MSYLSIAVKPIADLMPFWQPQTHFTMEQSRPLLPAKVLPLADEEVPTCRHTIDGAHHMRFQTDGLPRALILCPQGAITFEDDQQCLGIGGSDFGGQLVYIKALATSLKQAGFPGVDIVTRQFTGTMENGEPWPEKFDEPLETHPADDDVRVVRLPCGDRQFIPKEQLWTELPEWTANIEDFYQRESDALYADEGNGLHVSSYDPFLLSLTQLESSRIIS